MLLKRPSELSGDALIHAVVSWLVKSSTGLEDS
jgi:hypothetical protein